MLNLVGDTLFGIKTPKIKRLLQAVKKINKIKVTDYLTPLLSRLLEVHVLPSLPMRKSR